MEGSEEMIFALGGFMMLTDLELYRFVSDNHIVLHSIGTELCDNLRGVTKVNNKNAEE